MKYPQRKILPASYARYVTEKKQVFVLVFFVSFFRLQLLYMAQFVVFSASAQLFFRFFFWTATFPIILCQ